MQIRLHGLEMCGSPPIEELLFPSENSKKAQGLKGSGVKHLDVTKEPNVFSLRNLLLYYPAKLLRPAASMYDAIEDCLYLVDSENHAVRRADMGRRTLETVYPPCNTGKCDIQVSKDIPMDTDLAGPLQEECIWRQARGSAAEISGFDDMETSTQKVGVAQKWFDELDNLAFSGPEASVDEANGASGTNIQGENRGHIRTAINISPGTSEVIIYGALYLKMKKDSIYHATPWDKNVKRILNIINHKSEEQGTDACVQLISESSTDIEELVFMKPLNLRLEFDCRDHPKADKANEVVLTDPTIEVNVAL
ncbi:Nhl domain-containing protein [Thalictrum thalictroides]|uniref:Nhl domain-containing protein n=1 Tax=Thalictrum thalictroides TaxID=46969 RepID=A0A7J6XGM5_THATH|nr:Nhl domain-containing protein [Thalictrum thalictroides]